MRNQQLPGSGAFLHGWRTRPWKTSLCLASLFLLFSFPWPGLFYDLRVTHVQSRRPLLALPFFSGETFSLSFINSLYNAPVAEVFEARGPDIILREIATRSWEVIEYYHLPGPVSRKGEKIRVENINLKVGKLSLMIGFIGKQQLVWKERKIPLYRLSEPGGILLIESRAVSPALYLWQRAFHGNEPVPQESKT